MARPDTRALAAFAAVAVLACAAAAFAAERLALSAGAAAGFVGAIALGYAACAVGVARHLERTARSRAARLRELEERLALAGSEAEAHALLLGHVRTVLPGADTLLLAVSDSEALISPVHEPAATGGRLRELIDGRRTAQECLAICDGRHHERLVDRTPGLPAPARRCALCGTLEGEVRCEPLLNGGRTVGALLVVDERIGAEQRACIRDAARHAAPILAGHRRVEATERRAAADALTELPNRRAAERALRRLCAQAGRTVSPLSAILVELDAPGLAGRRAGDAALVLVARKLAQGIRASDFLARFDEQTFLVLAPDTDRSGAAELAEKLRAELERLAAPAVTSLAASLGVAALPTDALQADELMRQTTRAVASARALGGNRVREAESTTAP